MTNFDLVFDNGGGITLQTSDYCHTYSDALQAAEDVSQLLVPGAMPKDWDGNEPECRCDYDVEVERNGGYHWISENDVMKAVDQTPEEDRQELLENTSGAAERRFFEALFDLRDKAHLQQ